jgi:hypothetical protein
LQALESQSQLASLISVLQPLPDRLSQTDDQIDQLSQEVQSLKQQTQVLSAIVSPLPNALAIVLDKFLVELQQALKNDAP